MTEVDARGLSCPLPVMRTEEALHDGANELRVLVDSGTAKQNVANMLKDSGYRVEIAQTADEWTISASRA